MSNMIQFHRYELTSATPLNSLGARRTFPGALILVNGGIGCIHPWPELGDGNLEDHLQALRQSESTPLVRRALHCCEIDGEARRAGRSLFANETIPQSHATLNHIPSIEECDALATAGFSAVKIKVNGHDAGVVHQLEPLTAADLSLRLDFNLSLTKDRFIALVQSMSDDLRAAIDFVEDPFIYHRQGWREAHAATKLQLALDQVILLADPQSYDVMVWKPAKTDGPPCAARLIVTSYMDHAVGQMFAAYEAARSGTREFCGLLTHPLFERDPFFECIQSNGPSLNAPAGTGLGFDDLIAKLPWKPLV